MGVDGTAIGASILEGESDADVSCFTHVAVWVVVKVVDCLAARISYCVPDARKDFPVVSEVVKVSNSGITSISG